MNAGKLRYYVTVSTFKHEAAAFGGVDKPETKLPSCWADINQVSALRLRDGEQISEKATHKITMRYRDDITSDVKIYSCELGETYKVIRVTRMKRTNRIDIEAEQINS